MKQLLTLLLCFFLLAASQGLAQCIFGAHFDRRIFSGEMYAYGTACTYFTDDQAGIGAFPAQVSLRLYRKKRQQTHSNIYGQ